MKYAVVRIGGFQYKIAEGDEVEVMKREGEQEKPLHFSEVLLQVDGEKVLVGQPLVSGISVKAKIIAQFKGPKIRVATFKAKSRHRRTVGHRQELTRVKIEKIGGLS